MNENERALTSEAYDLLDASVENFRRHMEAALFRRIETPATLDACDVKGLLDCAAQELDETWYQ